MNSRPKVLAFTCSRNRPLMLRHCVMQMQLQNYELDHAIYINYDYSERKKSKIEYLYSFIDDINLYNNNKIFLGFGQSLNMHANYMASLSLCDVDKYDIFLKIDDDDIYRSNYVRDLVDDYQENKWDYSGSFSDGILNGGCWYPNNKLNSLGLSKKDKELGVLPIMPPTAAFSRRAIKAIIGLEATGRFEDIAWRQRLAADDEINCHVRRKSNFIYNIHGGNISTGSWLIE